MGTPKVQRLNALIDRWLPLLILAASAVALAMPSPWVGLKQGGSYFMAFNMFAVSTGIRLENLRELIRRPLLLAAAYLLLFGLWPLAASAVGVAGLSGDPELTTGLILMGAMPVGAMAVVWSGLEGGNVALTLTLVGLSTLTCGLVTPAVVQLAVQRVVPVDVRSLAWGLMSTVLLPSGVGLLLSSISWETVQRLRPHLNLGVRATTLVIVLATAAGLRRELSAAWGPTMMRAVASVAFQVLAGFALGYGVAGLMLRARLPDRLSLMFSTAMRNNVAGIILATTYFTPKVALPSVVALLIQQPLAGAIARLVKRRQPAAGLASTASLKADLPRSG